MTKFTKIALTVALTAGITAVSDAQVSYTGGVYSENFDSMALTTTYGATGWTGIATGSGSTLAPIVGTGSSATGGVYNFGSVAVPGDRALGSVASGTTVAAFGAVFTNNSGFTLTSLNLAFIAEQWRSGDSNTANEAWTFQLQPGATAITNAAFSSPLTQLSLNINEILTSTTAAAAVDGNAAPNRIAISDVITGLSIAPGATFAIRWVDLNDAGADAGMAIDDFSLSAVPEPSVYMLLGVGILLCGQRFLRRSKSA